ncbi:hypothetical protein WMY93_005967 [Mugilogobius chulae]|uniref:Uncharacterized protein n=1 Tax=Mugilogobius chulae TaxID=88201 RepID=A0AAW0PIG9_9GOBI
MSLSFGSAVVLTAVSPPLSPDKQLQPDKLSGRACAGRVYMCPDPPACLSTTSISGTTPPTLPSDKSKTALDGTGQIVMATGVIRSFLAQPTVGYFPLMFHHSSHTDPEHEHAHQHQDESERDDEEELQEEEEEEEEVFSEPAPNTLDVTNQLLRFADLINRDIQRYFGRSCGGQDACDIYNDSVSLTTSGRLRYYDDLLKIAKGGSVEERESGKLKLYEDGQSVPTRSSSLGPLAELFDQNSHCPGRPMTKRLLPLSFWNEPGPGLSSDSDTAQQEQTLAHAHHLEGAQMDFSDLLAFWDAHPEPPQPLTQDTP